MRTAYFGDPAIAADMELLERSVGLHGAAMPAGIDFNRDRYA